MEVPKHESEDYTGLHGVQTAQLQHNEEQEERPRQVGDEQVLQILQEAHSPQGNKIRGGKKSGRQNQEGSQSFR